MDWPGARLGPIVWGVGREIGLGRAAWVTLGRMWLVCCPDPNDRDDPAPADARWNRKA